MYATKLLTAMALLEAKTNKQKPKKKNQNYLLSLGDIICIDL